MLVHSGTKRTNVKLCLAYGHSHWCSSHIAELHGGLPPLIYIYLADVQST